MSQGEPLQLSDYLRVVLRRLPWVVGATVIFLVAATAYALLATPQYTGTATILVKPLLGPTGNFGTVGISALTTDEAIIKTAAVRKIVSTELKMPIPPTCTTSVASNTDLLYISCNDASAALAAKYANAFESAFLSYEATLASRAETAQLAPYESQYNSYQSTLAKDEKALTALPNNSPQATELLQTVQSLTIEANNALGQTSQIKAQFSANGSGLVQNSPAFPPSSPSSPQKTKDILIGAAVGLVLGLVIAFTLDTLDDRIRTKEDVERAYPGLSMLGFIPYVESWKTIDRPYLVALDAPVTQPTEAYRTLRTAIEFARLNRDIRSLVVTSSMALEGKTATVANLAVIFAKAGQRVCVVSGDLRRPRIGEFFVSSEIPGLTSIALGAATLEEACQPVSEVPGLFFLGTGPIPAEPAEFLSAKRTVEIFRELREHFDLVLIDTPPVLPVTDALLMGRYADGILLVVTAGRTHRRGLARVRELIEQTHLPVIGGAMNGTNSAGVGYGYGYGYGYGHNYSYGDYSPRTKSEGKKKGRSAKSSKNPMSGRSRKAG